MQDMKFPRLSAVGFAAAVCWLSAPVSTASPNHRVTITERLLGTDGKTFSVIRTESDNRGSYYSTNTKVHLIERSADTQEAAKTTLLSETATVVDATHNHPVNPPPVTTSVKYQDQELRLADILLKYPMATPVPWDEEKRARLVFHANAGVSLDNRVRLAGTREIATVFGEALKLGEWRIADVFEQGAGLFLVLEIEAPEGAPESRVLGIGPEQVKQVRAHLSREEIYLSAGAFPTREEAVKAIAGWKAAGKSSGNMTWEIWSRDLPTTKTDHVVVLPRTREMLSGGWSKRIEEEAGIRFEAIPSDRFVNWSPGH